MRRHLLISGALAIAGLAVMIFMAGPFALAADQPVEKAIGPQTEMKGPGGQEATGGKGETLPGELGKGIERPMKAPETEEIIEMDLKHLRVPDRADFENARESDSQSTVSF